MLSVYGDADAAMPAMFRFKFRSLASFSHRQRCFLVVERKKWCMCTKLYVTRKWDVVIEERKWTEM